jgi:hypothetical protein
VIEIYVEGVVVQQIDKMQYLGAQIIVDGRCDEDIRARLGMAKGVMSGMSTVWKNRGITIPTKLRLLRTPIWPIATYGVESWTYRKSEVRRIKAFETTSYRRILRIPWTAKRRNEEVLQEVGGERLRGEVVQRKLSYFGHIMRKENCLEKDIITGGTEGKRRRGRPRRMWIDDVKEWTGMTMEQAIRAAQQRSSWKHIVLCGAKVQTHE